LFEGTFKNEGLEGSFTKISTPRMESKRKKDDVDNMDDDGNDHEDEDVDDKVLQSRTKESASEKCSNV